MDAKYNLDWSDFAFASKKPINELNAIFIYAPREISKGRFKQIVKEYLPKGNLLLGISKEDHALGFEDQPIFEMLKSETVADVIGQVNKANSANKIYTISYFQREAKYLLEKLDFKEILLINGSWKFSFHTQEPYYVIAKKKTKITHISPFIDEKEAKVFESEKDVLIAGKYPISGGNYTINEMLNLAGAASNYSYDFTYQTGVVLGKKISNSTKYKFLDFSYNKVVPYQTHAMHFGAQREINYSPPNDLNFYDTVHAEVMMLIQANQKNIDLMDTSIFINLLPCPTCARMFSQTDITEFYYVNDHSDGYGLKMLESADKKVHRVVI
jgi:deoxycytidylate deaminase